MLRAALFGLAVLLSFTAGATHFRYGNMSWKRDLSYTGPGYKIDFTITESWRRGFAWSGYATQSFGANNLPDPGEQIKFGTNFPIIWGDGTPSQQVTLDVTSVIPTSAIAAEDIVNGVFNVSHIYTPSAATPLPALYTAYFEGAARLNAGTGATFLQNNGGGSFRVESKITVGNNNDAPVSTLPPVVNMVKGASISSPPATYQIPATDPNGDVITFSLAPSASFTQTSTAPNTQPFQTTPGKFTVSSTGLISFETYNLTIGAQYNAVIRLTDSRGGYVHLDIIVRITGPSNPPVFDYTAGNTPANNISYTIPIGQNLSFNVKATDPDAADAVTLFGVGIPVGATLTPALPLTGPVNGAAVTAFSWTPTASQVGSNVISFIAQDPQGVQTSTTVNVNVTCAVNFTTSVVDVACGVPGSITVTASGGTGPYSFSSDGGLNFVSGSSPYTFSGLTAGTYAVQVREFNGCVVENSTTVANIPDNTPPTINNLPANITVNNDPGVCGAAVTWTEPTVTDNCSGASIAQTAGPLNGAVFPQGTTTVTYTATDASSNTTVQNFTVTVNDNEAPVIVSVVIPASPVDISQLGRKSTYTNVKLNGGSNTIVVNPGASVMLTGSYSMVYDGGAGCSGCITQHYVGVNGTTLNCHQTGGGGSSTSGSINQGFTAPITPGVYYVTQGATWQYNCGDQTPTYNNVPEEALAVVIVRGGPCRPDITVNTATGSCGAAVTYVTPLGFDNCSAITVMQTAGLASGSSFQVGTTTNTFSGTDAASNTGTCSFNVTIVDNQKPVITTNGNKNVNTDANVCGASVTVSATASDNCSVGMPVGVRSDAQALNALYPVGTTIVTWNVTDVNGVAADAVTQTVTVTDNQAPVLTAPAAIAANADAGKCYATITALGLPTATDNCSLQPVTSTAPANSQYSVGINTVTYKVYDVNGNMATATQNITVTDNQNPTIAPPANVSVFTDPGQCSATSVMLGNPVVGDNCGVLSYSNNAPSVFPKGNTTVTWTVTDVNGRTATATQTVTVTDNELPTIIAPPAVTTTTSHDGTGNCSTTYNIGFPTVSDNCGVFAIAPSVNGIVISPMSYPFPIGTTTVRWEILDNSYNYAFTTQTVTVTDDEVPTLSGVPANVTVSCNAVPAVGSPTANDNCTTNPAVTYLGQVSTQGSSPIAASYYNYTITRTWKAMDASGNSSAIGTQVITVQDVTAPTFTRPANVTIYKTATCSYDASPAITGDVVNEMDNCQSGLQATYTDAASMVCIGNLTITRTWHLVDASGNAAADQVQTILVLDNMAPTFTAPPTATVYTSATCAYNVSPSVTGDVTNEADNCTTGLQASYTDALPVNGSCQGSKIITRTWHLVDDCGNAAADQVQIINVKDNTAPTFTAPPTATVYTTANCSYNASPTVTGDVTNEADNCSTGLNATYTEIVANGTCPGSKVITRTWHLIDNCGNAAADQVQTINVKDNTAPSFTRPADVTIYTTAACTFNASPSATGNPTNVADNCSTGLQPTYTDAVANGSCAGSKVITRTWKLVDGCGNAAADQIQTINVKDNIAPTFTRPADATIYTTAACTYNAAPSVTGSPTNVADNCSTGLQPTYNDVMANGSCQGAKVITRIWHLVDACGNAAPDQMQTINVKDNIAPTFTAPSAKTIYAGLNCSYDASPANTGDVTNEADNCSTGLNATYTDAVVANSTTGAKTITRTWKLTDACGNAAADQTQTITVLDNTPPTLACTGNITACDNFSGNSKTITLGVTDNCTATTTTWTMTGATTATGTGNSIAKSFNVGTSTIVWTVKDGANNTSACTTTVLIRTAPVAGISPSNADAFCNAVELTGSGTPSGTYSYAWTYNSAAFAATQTIRLRVANGDGNYTLVVTDGNGCASQPVSYNLQKQTLAAMYVLIGMREVELAQSNDVFNGSVGVTSSYGEAEFDKYCTVASPGAFVKAYDIDVNNPVTIPTRISSPAVVTFPTMLLNTASTSGLSNYTMTTSGTVTGNKKDLTINSGKSVTVTGNIFEDVHIGHDAVVTFIASDISMESLEMDYGAKIIFSGNTNLRVKDEVDIDKGCTVNPTGKKVTFYVKDASSSSHNHNCYSSWSNWHSGNHTDEKFIVDGKNTNIIANVYMPGGKLRVHGNGYSCSWSSNDVCNMTGLFIAEEIEGDGKNINWSSYDCAMPPSCRMAAPSVVAQVEEAADYKVLVYPNPTTGQFTVQFAQSADAELRITDIQGRLISQRSITTDQMPSATIDISSQAAGVYMVEIVQGGYTQRLRMVKQ